MVGISDYQSPDIPDLRFAHRDAEAFAEWLQSPAGGALDSARLKLLLNESATAGQFAAALDWLLDASEPGDQAIIYFSGHADVETKTRSQQGFLLTYDAPPTTYTAGGVYALVFLQDIVATLSIDKQVQVLVVFDACHSGKLAGRVVGGAQATAANLAQQFANEIKIMSCQPTEFSMEGVQWGGGRGAFSYHLTDGLYGLADRNNDRVVTLFEIGRYLDDHVTPEVAPQSQVPMTIGDRTGRVATVAPLVLENLRKFKKGELAYFLPMEQKNLENSVLGGIDTPVLALYTAYQKAIHEKQFFDPAEASADAYYTRLIELPELASIRGFLRRNYAAALQDDAQQAVNALLATDIREVNRTIVERARRYRDAPRRLARAAEILGPDHYLFATLKARELLFEGLVGFLENYASESPESGDEALEKYRASLRYQPEAPLTHYYMSLCFALKSKQPDSAYFHASEAVRLAESWVLPYAHLAYHLARYYQRYDEAEKLLIKAQQIDSDNVVVWTSWGALYYYQDKFEEAIGVYRRVIRLDSTNALAWTNLGVALVETQQYESAEKTLQQAIRINPRQFSSRYILACLYAKTGRPDEAETAFQQSLQINPNHLPTRDSIAGLLLGKNSYRDAEKQYLEIVRLNPAHQRAWYALACLAATDGRPEQALGFLEKSLETGKQDYQHIASDKRLDALRQSDGYKTLMRKFFPEKFK